MSTHSQHRTGSIDDLYNLLNSLVLLDIGQESKAIDAIHQRCLGIIESKLLPGQYTDRPLVIVISGGTNVGKSSVINWLADFQASPVSALARGTRSPVAIGNAKALAQFESTCLSNVRTIRSHDASIAISEPESPQIILVETTHFPPYPLVIIDSPDIDSDHSGNREWAYRLLEMSDAILFVVTPEKYNDAAVIRFLEEATQLQRTLIAIFNKNEMNESLEDFTQSVLRIKSSESNCLALPRTTNHRNETPIAIESIRSLIGNWVNRSEDVKRKALNGSHDRLSELCRNLATHLNAQTQWIHDVNNEISTISTRILSDYLIQLKQEKFTEFDRVFAVMMDQFHIAILDDVYSYVRSQFRRGYEFMKRHASNGSQSDRNDGIRLRERHRASSAFSDARHEIMRLPLHVPIPIRSLVEKWIAETDVPIPFDLDQYELDVTRISHTWVEDESKKILESIGDRKGFRYALTSIKAFFQLGSGVFSAFLTGGLSPIDAVVMPATERLMALLIENGIGRPYFRQRQNQFYELRRDLIRQHLDRVLFDPIRVRIPDLSFEQSEQLRAFAVSLSQPGALKR